MLIAEDSPLLRLPSNLSAKQAQFCDAVRFTAEMADIAYQQLLVQLLPLSGPRTKEQRLSAATPFLFAWSIIDSAHRLRRLVQNFPNLKDKNQSPEFRIFLSKGEAVEKLRNAVQHMDSDIHKFAKPGKAAWGTLTWVSSTQHEAIFHTCVLVSGAMMPHGGSHTFINLAGLVVRKPIDHVTITIDDAAVNLTDVMTALERLVQAIEGGLNDAFKDFPDRAGSDMFIALPVQMGPNGRMILLPQGERKG